MFDDLMSELSERLKDERLYVVPCSIHEFIAVPFDGTDLESLVMMLAEGNHDFTKEQDILSNSIYLYDAKAGKLSKAASYQ